MAFDPSRLFTQLLNTGLQNKDNPLYQLISQIIDALKTLTASTGVPGSSSGGSGSSLAGQSYVTVNNDTAVLPNSRQAIAGDFMSLDISNPGQIVFSPSEWSVLTNGDAINPELIYADGDVIMIHTP